MNKQLFECQIQLMSIDGDNLIPDNIFEGDHEIRSRIKDVLRSMNLYNAKSYMISWKSDVFYLDGLIEIQPGVIIGNFKMGVVYDIDGEEIGTGSILIQDGGEDGNDQCILVSLFGN